jgi:hypothetical protein
MGEAFSFHYTALMTTPKVLLLFAFLFSSAVFARKSAVIQGHDKLALPGQEVELVVKLEKAKVFPFRSDIKKQMIHFYFQGKLLGEAKTKKDGLAKLKVVFDKKGIKIIKSNLSPKSKYKANQTDNRILVLGADEPILITDIDHTIADISVREYLRTPDEDIPELFGASKTLNILIEDFHIVYLTARDDYFIKRSKFWLDFMNFPKGPAFFWDFGFWNGVPFDHGEFKELQIRKLRKMHHKILIGVGDKPHDVTAYRRNGLRAYYIGLPGEVLAKGTITVRSWDEISKHLLEHPIGSLGGDPSP